MNSSIKMNIPCEFVNITKINPLISHVEIKVCYVGEEPNRNKSVITKDVAKEIAQSLPGSPIVGFFNEDTQDFDGHTREIEISGGKVKWKDITKPYGFVDLGARVWFQKYLDNGETEHEYLCTEGYIWTGQYPESQRIIDKGNNQSMELDHNTLDAHWAKSDNGLPQFFIINEAIISKLCILGEDVEPCFEGANITKFSLGFDDDFKNTLYSMINEIREYVKGGNHVMYTEYAVEIGDALWCALYDHLARTYPNECCGSQYRVEGIYEEAGSKFAILSKEGLFFKMDINIINDAFSFGSELTEVTKTFTPRATGVEPQFNAEAYAAYEAEYASAHASTEAEEEQVEETAESESTEAQEETEAVETEEAATEETSEATEESSSENEEYAKLLEQFNNLTTEFNALKETAEAANQTIADLNNKLVEFEALRKFKQEKDREAKQNMINNFYMLSDEDKKDVIENIDTYSLDEIEAKLSVVCFRNKVNFSLDEDNNGSSQEEVSVNVNEVDLGDSTPPWIQAIQRTAEEK